MPTPARLHVAHALHGVFGDRGRVPDVWDRGLGEEAALAQALLGRCLRHWGRLQAHVRPQLKDPGRGVPLGTQVALAVGLAQLAWLPGVADFAAVNEAVGLVADREVGFPPHRGLVNALLRRAAKDREGLQRALEDLPPALDRTPFADRVLAAALAPHGRRAEVEGLWSRLSQPPRAAFRCLRGEVPAGLEADPGVPGCLRQAGEAPFPRAWLESGAGMVQDRSSQALLAYAWEGRPARILDACAAPGGKTTGLVLRHPEAELWALERQPRRAERLKRTLAQRGLAVQVEQADAAEWLEAGGRPFDLILLDAPCSGSGTLQKHPELPWLGDALDLSRLVGQQRRLLEAALGRLAPGGLLVYAVCSWLPEEAADHLAWIQSGRSGCRPAPIWDAALGVTQDRVGDRTSFFRPDPFVWEGEGFQAFALVR
jgi:16S rRNA (cytosine967-C5)-methyltransferase